MPPAGIPIGHQEALQAAVLDPLSPPGFTLTALTQVSVVQGPIVVNLTLGSDGVASINLAPYGFSVPFYGASYNQLWLCVNGFLTLGAPDSDFSPTVLEFNTGAPRIAAFWSDLEQQPAAPWQVVRYTIDPAPPGGQPPFVRADWINVPDWGGGSQFFHTFSTTINALGVCTLSYQTLTAPSIYALLCGIGPGLGVNPQAAKDLSALHVVRLSGSAARELLRGLSGPRSGWRLAQSLRPVRAGADVRAVSWRKRSASTVSYMLY